MDYKKFWRPCLVIVLIFASVLGLVNWYMDPLWCWPERSHSWNQAQEYPSEQQEKTNRLYFGSAKYDSLILGSSGVTAINAEDIVPNGYNYAAAGVFPRDYVMYANFFREIMGKDPDIIVLGVEFSETDRTERDKNAKQKEDYIGNTTSFLYRERELFSISLFEISRKNFRHARLQDIDYKYDRQGHHILLPQSDIVQRIEKFQKSEIDQLTAYQYDEDYKRELQNLRDAFPYARFVVFTVPNSAPVYQTMIDEGKWNDYERWLTDVVEVFGTVHHMMWNNSFTEDVTNYRDPVHFSTSAGKNLVDALKGMETDFDMVLTPENLQENLHFLRGNAGL